jgi:hypothetical protein
MWTPFLDLRSKFLDLGSKFGLSQVHRQAEESSIYQFKLFDDSSLVFVADQIGLSDHAVQRSELEQMPADVAMEACASR